MFQVYKKSAAWLSKGACVMAVFCRAEDEPDFLPSGTSRLYTICAVTLDTLTLVEDTCVPVLFSPPTRRLNEERRNPGGISNLIW